MSQPREAQDTAYVDSVVDPSLEPRPYIALDIEGDEHREIVRYGDMWFSYDRVRTLVSATLESAQDETNRAEHVADHDFDMRVLQDNDVVKIGYRLYTGYAVKSLLEADRETLLSAGPVIPHECPELEALVRETIVEKPSFWRDDKTLILGLVNCVLGFLVGTVFVSVLTRCLEMAPGLKGEYGMAALVAMGLSGLSWLLMEQLAARRKQSGQATPYSWRLFTFFCINGGVFSVAAIAVASLLLPY